MPVTVRNAGTMAGSQSIARTGDDGFEIGGDNGERVRIAFTLDCCDREAISWVATTGGIDSSDIRDLMIESVERRFGLVGMAGKGAKPEAADSKMSFRKAPEVQTCRSSRRRA